MSVPFAVEQAYRQLQGPLDGLRTYVADTLRAYCDRNGLLFQDRIKDLQSFSEKLESGRFSALSEIDDLYACRVIVPTRRTEREVLEFLTKVFEKRAIRGRGHTSKPPDVFRFDSTRFYGRARVPPGLPPSSEFQNLTFEVQLPTAFEYAWQLATHDLIYKSDSYDWKRLRLAAQLKATVEQMDMIIEAFDSSALAVTQFADPDTDAKSGALETFKALQLEGLIPSAMIPGSWTLLINSLWELAVKMEDNRNRRRRVFRELVKDVETFVRGGSVPLSGSLMQLAVAAILQARGEGALVRFPVVKSRELRDLYGITDLPCPFLLDL